MSNEKPTEQKPTPEELLKEFGMRLHNIDKLIALAPASRYDHEIVMGDLQWIQQQFTSLLKPEPKPAK